jgi:hypothetical protein
MFDLSKVKLGRKPARKDARTLKLADYIKGLPPPPESVDNTQGVQEWGMFLNDQIGDCTIAACLHCIQVLRLSLESTLWLPPDSLALELYEKWAGYEPGNPSTDQGAEELGILTDWRKSTIDGHNLFAFVEPDPQNLTHIEQAIYLFGGVYIGLDLPASIQGQEVWDVVDGPAADDILGGHAVYCPAYDGREGTITAITWGALQKMTVNFWLEYCEESHALLSATDWNSPQQIGYQALQADLAQVTN